MMNHKKLKDRVRGYYVEKELSTALPRLQNNRRAVFREICAQIFGPTPLEEFNNMKAGLLIREYYSDEDLPRIVVV